MLYTEVILFLSANQTKYIFAICGQNVEFVNDKLCGTDQ